MAVRLYPSVNAFVTFGTFTSKGSWDTGITTATKQLWNTKSQETVNGFSPSFEISAGPWPERVVVSAMYITDAMTANKAIGGTFQLCVPVQGTNLMVYNWSLHIWATVGDTNVVRATLLNQFVQGSGVNQGPWRVGFFDPPIFYSLPSPVGLTTGSMFAGDRIVVELGYTVYSGGPGGVLSVVGVRDSGGTIMPDGAAGAPFVDDAAVWFEFSDDILLQPPNLACINVCPTSSPPGTVPNPIGSLPWTAQCPGLGQVDKVTSLTVAETW